jgi:hypothetical protein
MKSPSTMAIAGKSVCLVPYAPEHVPQYHRWMQARMLAAYTCAGSQTTMSSFGIPSGMLAARHWPCYRCTRKQIMPQRSSLQQA